MAAALVDKYVEDNKVMVFSKSYCPYCQMAKAALDKTGVKYCILEIEDRCTLMKHAQCLVIEALQSVKN